ncbi:hypothetical protein LEP1GSC192_2063 [Leptospira sp. B5-022]|nr:hypothetical protein LEP1GSC192_2063 [Leptospira sp. B5-022]
MPQDRFYSNAGLIMEVFIQETFHAEIKTNVQVVPRHRPKNSLTVKANLL